MNSNRNVFKMSVFFCFVFFASMVFIHQAYAADQNIYIDSNAGSGGNGTIGTPYKLLASINWTTVGNWVTAGDTVYINLKRGSVFRETMTVTKSGASGKPITIQDYGTGNKPIIKGSNLFSGTWSTYAGAPQTYQISAPVHVYFLWKDGVYYTQGTSQNTLLDKQWFWVGNVLYVRDSAGNPDSTSSVVEGSVRAIGISMSAKNYITIKNLEFQHTDNVGASAYGIAVNTSGQNISIIGCEFRQANGVVIDSTTNFLISNSYFGAVPVVAGNSLNQVAIRGASTTGTISYSLFVEPTPTNKLKIFDSSVNIYNSLFDTYNITPIISTSAGTVTVKNSIFSGANQNISTEVIKHTGTGTFTLANSLILPQGITNSGVFLKGVTDGGGNIYREAKWVKTPREGIVYFIIDDTGNVINWDNISKLADEFGYPIGSAFNALDLAQKAPIFQDGINRGHYITNHSTNHDLVTATTPFTIQYVGAGTAALLTIASSTFSTVVDNAPQDNLALDLNSTLYDTAGELCTYIITRNYSCIQSNPQQLTKILTKTLADVSSVDIKTASYIVLLDIPKYLTSEINDNDTATTNTFTEADGVTPYIANTFAYPFGATDLPGFSVVEDWLQSLGYIGARSGLSQTSDNWKMEDGIELYKTRTTNSSANHSDLLGLLSVLLFQNNTNDADTATPKSFANVGNHITFTNQIYDPTTGAPTYSGVFNGTNAYARRLYDVDFDFSKGDGYIAMSVKPNSLTTKQTLYFQGSDDNNYQTFYISNTGSLIYSIVTGGIEIVHAESATNVLVTNTFARVGVVFYEDVYRILVNSIEVASVTSTAKPFAYTGANYIGARYNFSTAQATDFFNGHMGMFSIAKEVFMRFTSVLASTGNFGGFLTVGSHVEAETPLMMYRVMFEALNKYTGQIKVFSFPDAVNYLKGKGTTSADGKTVTWAQPNDADYHLRATSPGINNGTNLGFSADYDGNSIVGTPDIGPFEYQP